MATANNVTETITNGASSATAIVIDGSDTSSNAATTTTIETAAVVVSNILLFLLVAGMAATVELRSMQRQMRNWRAVGLGLLCQFVLLPFTGYCVVQLFTLPPSVGITLLLVVSSPGGSYSNWWCSLLNADLALSVTMTTVSTLLSIGFLPANLILWTRAAYQDTTTATGEAVLGSLDFMGIFVSILLVIAAIGVGLLGTALFARSPAAATTPASAVVGNNNTNNRSTNTTTTTTATTTRSHQFHKYTNLAGNISGILLILFSTVLSFATGDGETSDLAGGTAQFYPAIGLPILVGLLGATVLASCVSSLSKPERLTTAVECCYQNTAIAQTAAISLFSGEDLKGKYVTISEFGYNTRVILIDRNNTYHRLLYTTLLLTIILTRLFLYRSFTIQMRAVSRYCTGYSKLG